MNKYRYYTFLGNQGEKVSLISLRVIAEKFKEIKDCPTYYSAQIKEDTAFDTKPQGAYFDHFVGDYIISYEIM